MFASERIKTIKRILMEKKHVNVTKLSEMLNVSEVTIRRDFEKLEREKFLVRTHGGAYLNDDMLEEEEMDEEAREDDPYMEERFQISKNAVQMIEDDDSIILSSGKTNLCIAKGLMNKRNLTVLTNDINIAYELSANSNIKVTMPGGELNPASMTLSGKLTDENIKKFFVSKAFIEVEGASIEHGFTVKSMEKASVIREMLSISSEKIFLCHYKIFDNISFYKVGPLDLANKVITNIKVSDRYKDYFFNNNLKLFTSIKSEGDVQ